jgi:uncharacterized membrane protein YhdT
MKTPLTILALICIVIGVVNFYSTTNADGQVGLPLLITHPLLMASMFYLLIEHVFPALIFRVPRERLDPTERAVRASGEPWATVLTSGRIGGLNLSGPLLRATVHPGGIAFKPLFLAPFALTAGEITAATYQATWLKRGLEITHHSPQVASPILVRCAEHDPFVAAAQRLMEMPAAHRPLDPGAAPDAPATASTSLMSRGVVITLQLLGIVVGLYLIYRGIAWAIPTLGAGGIAWTGTAVLILLINVYWLVRGKAFPPR